MKASIILSNKDAERERMSELFARKIAEGIY